MIFFHVCCYGFSQGRKSLYNSAVYVVKKLYQLYRLKFFLIDVFVTKWR